MNTKLVVFDMAGTTVRDDDAVNRCLCEALLAGGVEVSRDEINAVMGLPKPVAITRLLADKLPTGPALSGAVDRMHDDFVARMIGFYQADPRVVAMPGAMECLISLKKLGVKIALDTGFSRTIVDTILERLEW
ncbi:MAG TPA: HAD hydrolase-like protein, partial [Candidatus Paceibacterota bacterium]|nr:HAD hydrolase-like protein [Candidatus Paceibacterota bacterium]